MAVPDWSRLVLHRPSRRRARAAVAPGRGGARRGALRGRRHGPLGGKAEQQSKTEASVESPGGGKRRSKEMKRVSGASILHAVTFLFGVVVTSASNQPITDVKVK